MNVSGFAASVEEDPVQVQIGGPKEIAILARRPRRHPAALVLLVASHVRVEAVEAERSDDSVVVQGEQRAAGRAGEAVRQRLAAHQRCANSVNAAGAHLAATGDALVQDDTLVLTASGMPATASSLFFQGTSSTSGAAFGDGIRCVTGSIVRLGTKTAVGGNASFPGVGNQHVSVRGSVPTVGGGRYYQCWYRNAAAFCTPSTFNLTNAVEVRWLP